MNVLNPNLILAIICGYFILLFVISRLTSRNSNNQSFFIANKKSPWYLVAFGMIGATLSGVTFISVPGWVGSSQFSYMQMVLGYMVGYAVIATVLMPMYYRLNLTSIYSYLEQRFGIVSYKTGAGYFLLSRTIGASFRLYLVAIVLQQFVMNSFGVPFWCTVAITILLVWVYTFKGGLKTIVWTDTLQTLCMLLAVILTVIAIANAMDVTIPDVFGKVRHSDYSKMFFFENGWSDGKNFFKQFLAGASFATVMTGLDQDMMQKNLSCRNIRDAQKNMFWFSVVLVFANLLFLTLGALLFIYTADSGIEIPTRMVGGVEKEATDLLYPSIALEHLSPWIGVVFLLGLIAAAYSSADSALTALTTSVCIDFLNFEKRDIQENRKIKIRRLVHILFSVVLFTVIISFWWINDDEVIAALFKVSGYTYGPLLGIYAFGFFRKERIWDRYAIVVCLIAPVLTYLVNLYSKELFNGYVFGFELLIMNGLLTYLGLWLIRKKRLPGR